MKLAIVHDWLTGMRGGEKCLEHICRLYPKADIYTLVADRQKLSPALQAQKIFPSKFQNLPGVKNYYRYLLPFMPAAARQLSKRMKDYDLVISVSHCFAKNVLVPKEIPHISYCLTPMRYIRDQYQAYFAGKQIEPFVRPVAAYLRAWDNRCSADVDHFIAISNFISKRIKDCYGKDSTVIYPPVDTEWITQDIVKGVLKSSKEFLVVNALVPYKNTHLIVEAFNRLALPLTIVGKGPELQRISSMAGRNIKIIEEASSETLAELYQNSRALIFAAEEDFGITPVEAQAAGRPVIAYRGGGALETVLVPNKSRSQAESSGIFFDDLTPDSIEAAVYQFLAIESGFRAESCKASARRFSVKRFDKAFSELVDSVVGEKFAGGAGSGGDYIEKHSFA